MITDEELKTIIYKVELSDEEILLVLQRYIYDKKGKEVKISRPTGAICLRRGDWMGQFDLNMMDHFYNVAIGYYTTEVFKTTD